jgi:hypothetical protein
MDGFVRPLAEYGREKGCSVTGGYVYRGKAHPALVGAYYYGDYCSGIIWALYQDRAGAWQAVELLDSDARISSFGEDEAGEVYIASLGDGVIYRLAAAGR